MKKIKFKNTRSYYFKILVDYFLQKLLLYRAKKHYKDGFEQIAIYSFDLIGNAINISGTYEKSYLTAFHQFLDTYFPEVFNKNFIDVGANVGTHTLFMSNIFSKVYSFEPNIRTFKLLNLNCSDKKNIEIYNYAVGKYSGVQKLFINKINQGASSLINTNRHDIIENINIKNLDSFLLKNIGVLKIDAEGAELDVLIGAKNLIEKEIPIILIEINNGIIKDSTVLNFLKEIGYTRIMVFDGLSINGLNIISYLKNAIKNIINPCYEIRLMCDKDNGSHHNLVIALHDNHPTIQ